MTTVTRDLSCPPRQVLDVLADGWTYASWVVGSSRIRAVDAAWPQPGSRLAHSFGVWPAVIDDTTTCLAWHPDGGIELQARGWPAGEARVRIRVMPRPGGCRVEITEDAVRGPGLLVPRPLRQALITPRNVEALRRLAGLAERRDLGGHDDGTATG